MEVRPVANYFRAELLIDDPTKRTGLPKGRWDAGVWVHRDSQEEAIAAAEALAVAAGLVNPRVEGT